jgi:nitrogen fixation NifU-like protein
VSLEDLYQEVIMDHYRRPRNFGRLEGVGQAVEHENPACGDQLELFVRLEDGRIGDIRFVGRGCAISMASASLMTETVKGKSVSEAEEAAEGFLCMLRGDRPAEGLGDLAALSGVRQFPLRVKCAALAWHALREALGGYTADGGEGATGPGA